MLYTGILQAEDTLLNTTYNFQSRIIWNAFFFFLSFYRQLKPDFVERCYVNCVKWLLCVKLATYIFIGNILSELDAVQCERRWHTSQAYYDVLHKFSYDFLTDVCTMVFVSSYSVSNLCKACFNTSKYSTQTDSIS